MRLRCPATLCLIQSGSRIRFFCLFVCFGQRCDDAVAHLQENLSGNKKEKCFEGFRPSKSVLLNRELLNIQTTLNHLKLQRSEDFIDLLAEEDDSGKTWPLKMQKNLLEKILRVQFFMLLDYLSKQIETWTHGIHGRREMMEQELRMRPLPLTPPPTTTTSLAPPLSCLSIGPRTSQAAVLTLKSNLCVDLSVSPLT